MSAWTTAERTNTAGERTFVFQRHCYRCPFVQEEAGAITEEPERAPWLYVQKVRGEPDD
jgi:hypothetical protein